MNASDIEAEWRNPENWRGCFYFSAKDPRIFVPKKDPSMGWTLNFSRKTSIPILAAILLILIGQIFIFQAFGTTALLLLPVVIILEVAILAGSCIYFSSTERAARRKNRPNKALQ